MIQTARAWWQDHLLRGILKNSAYLFSSNSLSAVLSFAQGVFATRLLHAEGYGLVSGTVIVFATNVNRLLSFRMSEVVVKHLGQQLADGNTQKAAAAVKLAGLTEAATSVIAYLVLLLLSPLAAVYFGKDAATQPLFAFYGLVLLSNLVYETSTGVLQTTGRFGRIAMLNAIQSIITFTVIFWAFLFQKGLYEVLAAYLLGKTFTGVAVVVLAFRGLNEVLGKGWWRAPLSLAPSWRQMGVFAVSTNLWGTITLAARDSETLLIAFFTSQTQVGYFRLAQTVINLIMLPMDPMIAPTYAEITRTINERRYEITQRLLKRVSTISGLWTLAAGGGMVLLGWWIIPTVYGSEYAPSYAAFVLLLIGYGFANIFQWNRPLLLAMGNAAYPLKVSAVTLVAKTLLTVILVPVFGYLGEAAILSGYFLVSVGIILRRGLGDLRKLVQQAA